MPISSQTIHLRAMLCTEAINTFRTAYPSLPKADQLALVTAWERAVAAELRKVQKRPEPGTCTPRRRKNA